MKCVLSDFFTSKQKNFLWWCCKKYTNMQQHPRTFDTLVSLRHLNYHFSWNSTINIFIASFTLPTYTKRQTPQEKRNNSWRCCYFAIPSYEKNCKQAKNFLSVQSIPLYVVIDMYAAYTTPILWFHLIEKMRVGKHC